MSELSLDGEFMRGADLLKSVSKMHVPELGAKLAGTLGEHVEKFSKALAPVALVVDGMRLAEAVHDDGGTFGAKSAHTTGSIAGGVAGTVAGGEIGSVIGGGIGAIAGIVGGPVGIPIGEALGSGIGGFVGSVVGGMVGAKSGEAFADHMAQPLPPRA